MRPRLAASAALALAAHGALMLGLVQAPPTPGGAVRHAALSTRMVDVVASTTAQALPTTAAPDDSHRQDGAAQPPLAHAATAEDGAGATPAPDRYAPTLAPDVAHIAMPDAALPNEGVVLRVLLQLDAQGLAAATDFAAPPQTPPGFIKTTELALRRGLLQLPQEAQAQTGLAYCLRVRFMPDGAEPELAWLPGIAHSREHCLQGREPVARVLQ